MRFIRRIVLFVLLFILLLLGAVQLLGDPLARRVVASLNAQVQTKISVQHYDLSLLRAFPQLAVDLRQVHVTGSDGSALLEADHLACVLDLSSLFGAIRVSGIRIRDGKLQLFTDRDGNTNYQVTHTSVGDRATSQGGGAAGATFSVEAAQLENVTIVYQDARLQTDALLRVRQARLGGNFSTSRYALETSGSVELTYFDQEGVRYLERRTIDLEGQVSIDQDERSYRFTPLVLSARDLSVEATGVLTLTDAGLTTNLRLSSTAGELADVLALLPPAYAATLGELETDGQLAVQADVTGAWTDEDYPRLNGTLAFRDGRLSSPRMDATARNVELLATFTYLDGPRGGVQTFAVKQLTGTFSGAPFDLKFRLEDLDDPVITFSAKGSLPLGVLPALLPEGTITEAEGLLHFADVTLSGRYADMVEPRRASRLGSTGTLRLENAQAVYRGHSLSLPTGTVLLRNNELLVDDLTVVLPNTQFTLAGRGSNLIPVLFSDSLNTHDAALRFTATLSGDRVDLAELLKLTAYPEGEAVGRGGAVGRVDSVGRLEPQLTDLLHGTFEADIAEWQWGEMHGSAFRGQLVFLPGRLDVRGLTDAMGGQFRIDAITYFEDSTSIDARVAAQGVDAREFFRQSDNFGQEVLTADHLTGRMDAKLLLDLTYDETGALDYDRLGVLASLDITDGELHDFAMLENFAFALKSGDLERVRFTRLSNVFEIRDRTIYIPAMFIQSSAINFTLSGSHTFDQYLAYYVKVNAGQVVTNKLSRHDGSLEVLPARNGLFNVYYTIKGPLDTYTVRSDKRAVKTDFRRSTYRRNRIRRELANRFRTPITLFELPEAEDAVE